MTNRELRAQRHPELAPRGRRPKNAARRRRVVVEAAVPGLASATVVMMQERRVLGVWYAIRRGAQWRAD
jgi:hypothetical protein